MGTISFLLSIRGISLKAASPQTKLSVDADSSRTILSNFDIWKAKVTWQHEGWAPNYIFIFFLDKYVQFQNNPSTPFLFSPLPSLSPGALSVIPRPHPPSKAASGETTSSCPPFLGNILQGSSRCRRAHNLTILWKDIYFPHSGPQAIRTREHPKWSSNQPFSPTASHVLRI